MKRLIMSSLVLALVAFSFGAIQAEELEDSITLEESLIGMQFSVKVIRKAAVEEGYSKEESRMVALAAMEGLKEGLTGKGLVLAVRERAKNKISGQEASMIQTKTRTQTRTRTMDGNIPDDVKTNMIRQEEATRGEGGSGGSGGTGGKGGK